MADVEPHRIGPLNLGPALAADLVEVGMVPDVLNHAGIPPSAPEEQPHVRVMGTPPVQLVFGVQREVRPDVLAAVAATRPSRAHGPGTISVALVQSSSPTFWELQVRVATAHCVTPLRRTKRLSGPLPSALLLRWIPSWRQQLRAMMRRQKTLRANAAAPVRCLEASSIFRERLRQQVQAVRRLEAVNPKPDAAWLVFLKDGSALHARWSGARNRGGYGKPGNQGVPALEEAYRIVSDRWR